MESIIKTLKGYAKEVIDSDIDISRRTMLEKPLMEAIANLEYANKLAKANKIKLGD